VFAIQDEISAKVAASLQSTLYRETLQQRAALRTDNMEAYDAYLLALHFRGDHWPAVLEHATTAAQLDPDFVSAHTLMAHVYMTRVGGTMPSMQAYPAARRALETALSLAPDYAPALIVQAHMERQDRDYIAAEALFRRAKAISPNQSSRDLANLLQMLGRLDEALEEYRRSAALDPLEIGFYTSALFSDGSFEQAMTMTEDILPLVSDRWRYGGLTDLAAQNAYLGNSEQANYWLEQALAMKGPVISVSRGIAAYALARLGRNAEAESIIEEIESRALRQYVSPAALFWAYLGTGDLKQTFAWLDRAIDENVYIITMAMRTSVFFDELRDDPRFDAALDRVSLLTE
jgi:tetratricopeptide (TPR) repeat protein